MFGDRYHERMSTTLIDSVRSRRLAAPLVGYPAVSYTGTTVRTAITDATAQAEALLAYFRAARPDVLFPFMDLSVEAEAMGLPVRFKEMDSPDVTEHPVKRADDLCSITRPNPEHAGRLPVYLEVIRRLIAETDALVGGYAASPFTVAGLLMSAEELAMNTMLEPELCHSVLEVAAEVSVSYVQAQEAAGAHLVVLLDPTAALLSPELYEQFAGPYVRRVIESVSIPVVLHVCGQTTRLIPSFVKDPVAGLSLDSEVDLPAIAPGVPEQVILMGNIAPVDTMLNGTPDAIRAEVRALMEAMSARDSFVPSTGCDVPPGTPRENLEAFPAAVREP